MKGKYINCKQLRRNIVNEVKNTGMTAKPTVGQMVLKLC